MIVVGKVESMRRLQLRLHVRLLRWALCITLGVPLAACDTDSDPLHGASASDTTAAAYFGNYTREEAALIATLARGAGGTTGTRYEVIADSTPTWSISGAVTADASIRGDSLVEPLAGARACRPFRDTPMPRRGDGVGNAIVWLTGVGRGRANDLPRRTSVRLANCALSPRVHIVAQGGTVLVGSHDAIEARLRLHEAIGDPARPRATVMLNDFGQIVPNSAIAAEPGLVEVRDDHLPWVRGYIAVSPHPYVAITDATGAFRLDGVPSGTYQLVVFSETLGVRVRDVRVEQSNVTVELEFR
jgi:hypothetical protein